MEESTTTTVASEVQKISDDSHIGGEVKEDQKPAQVSETGSTESMIDHPPSTTSTVETSVAPSNQMEVEENPHTQASSTAEPLAKEGESKSMEFSASVPLDIAAAELQHLLPPSSAFYSSTDEDLAIPAGEVMGSRYLMATRDIPAMHPVLVENPMVVVVADKKEFRYCNHCFVQMQSPMICPNCEAAYYCSQQCFDLDKHAGLECLIFTKLKSECKGDNPIGYACRMLIKIVQNFANTQDKDQLEKFYTFMYCVSNSKELEKSQWSTQYHRRCKVVEQFLEGGVAGPLLREIAMPFQGLGNMLFEIICKIHCNAFAVKGESKNDCGNAIFLKGALLNHSCSPNCVIVPSVNSLQIMTSKHVSAGSELTIQYCPAKVGNLPRRAWLQQNYFFNCMCEYCKAVNDIPTN